MREKRKWDGYSYGKTIPSLQAYPQKITSKNGRGFFFCDGFPKEKGNTFFSEFSRDFSRISPLYFSIFLPIFFPFFSHIFLQKWGYLQESVTLQLASYFYHIIELFCLFLIFQFKLHVAVWRPFRDPFSLNFIFLKISGCLVSNGSSLARFGATVVKISLSKERGRSAEKFCDDFP